jgi:hypothetical protein
MEKKIDDMLGESSFGKFIGDSIYFTNKVQIIYFSPLKHIE